MNIAEYTYFELSEVLPLYAAAGWTNYTDRPDMLEAAYAHSLLALAAYDDEKLVGVIRAVGDGHSIVLVQDILVLPEYRRRGVGTALMRAMLDRFRDVYQLQLLTDDTPRSVGFYCSLGFVDAAEYGCRAFMRP